MDPTNDNENNASSISSDLIRGHINTIILRTLYDGDKYGYEIINEIEEKSKGQYSLKQPTLYSALKRLESQDYVTSYWGGVSNGGRRKYFQITDKGKKIVEQNLAEWEYSRTVIDSLISEKDYDFNNPPPSAVDFSLLRKSTTRVPRAGGVGHDEIELGTYESDSADEADQPRTADQDEQDEYTAEETQSGENELDTLLASLENSDDASSQADTVNEVPQTSEPEKLRFDDTVIYENLPYPAESQQEVVDGAALESAASPEEETPVGETTAVRTPKYVPPPKMPPRPILIRNEFRILCASNMTPGLTKSSEGSSTKTTKTLSATKTTPHPITMRRSHGRTAPSSPVPNRSNLPGQRIPFMRNPFMKRRPHPATCRGRTASFTGRLQRFLSGKQSHLV